MRVLLIHNRYQIAGGEDVVVQAEKNLLESHQHAVSLLEADNKSITGPLGTIKTGISTIYSSTSRRRVLEEIDRFNPDIVHVHNFFPLLSPSVYDASRQRGIPVVQTLHNYRLICPKALCFRDGHHCEDCIGKFFAWPGVWHACYRQSRIGTAAVAAMLTAHRLAGTWDNKVDVYIALTEFGREQFIRGGIPEGKIVVKPHFVDSPPPHQGGRGEYALYVGRLSEEKGIRVLLDAWKQLGKDLPLKIIGDGPMTKEVAEAAHRQGGICLLGRQPREKVLEFMEQAELLVFPSVCNETFGLTIIEAFSVGLPVIASDLGVVTSLVEHQRTGLRFKPGNAEDLAAKVRDAISRPADLEQMRKAARAEYVAKYTPEHNYEMLIEIYQRVLKSK